jgi:AraC-like DNA-binding protein
LSRRQLERLFQKYLNCSPSRYYLKLRLIRARQLLKQTSLSIVELTHVCGFVSTPHFSKCYREHFGVPPSDERGGSEMSRKPALKAVSTQPLTVLEQARNESTFASIRMVDHADLAQIG